VRRAPATPVSCPASPSAFWRAQSTAQKLAMEEPVSSTPEVPAGMPSIAAAQAITCRSTTIPAWSRPPQLAFIAPASNSASIETGLPPPCTQPMKRGWRLPVT